MNFTTFCCFICFYFLFLWETFLPRHLPTPTLTLATHVLSPTLSQTSRGECSKMSWVVGVGVAAGVIVVVKKKTLSKKKMIIKIRQKVVKFMKRRSPRTYQSHSPFPRSAKQISESFSTNGRS